MNKQEHLKKLQDGLIAIDKVIAELTNQYQTWTSGSDAANWTRQVLDEEIGRMREMRGAWVAEIQRVQATP